MFVNTTLPKNPRKPSAKLTYQDAKLIRKLQREGHLQQRIAAMFDVNQGRISDVLSGKLHPEV